MTLEISVPGKIIFFGEWAVTQGGAGIASALTARLTLTVSQNGHARGVGFASENKSERCADLTQPIEGFFGLASQVISELSGADADNSPWNGQQVTFSPGWKIEEGLGSSSAVILSLLIADAQLRGHAPADEATLWRRGRELIRRFQSPKASGLDLAAQTLGGHVLLQGHDPLPLNIQVPPQIKVLHTGDKISTEKSLKTRTPPPEFVSGLNQSVMNFLRARDWVKAMREHHQLLDEFGVVPHEIKALRREWLDKGWIKGLKTTGAGGGDALLIWVNPEAESLVKAGARERGWWWGAYGFGAGGWKINDR